MLGHLTRSATRAHFHKHLFPRYFTSAASIRTTKHTSSYLHDTLSSIPKKTPYIATPASQSEQRLLLWTQTTVSSKDKSGRYSTDLQTAITSLKDSPLGSLTPKNMKHDMHRLIRVLIAQESHGKNNFDGVATAEALLRRMVREREHNLKQRNDNFEKKASTEETDDNTSSTNNEVKDVEPIFFNLVMNGWAKRDGDDAAKRTEQIFDLMRRESKADTIGYNTVLKAWARAAARNDRDAPEKAESLLQDMISEYEQEEEETTGEEGSSGRMKPNRASFGSVIDAWANASRNKSSCHRDIAGERAHAVLNQMLDWYKRERQREKDDDDDNATSIAPDVRCFTGVIAAYANANHSRHSAHMEKAENLLHQMIRFQEQNPHLSDLKPDNILFTTMIQGHASCASNHPKSAEKARNVLRLMMDLSEASDGETAPRTNSFNAVLNAYAKASQKDKEAAYNAEDLLSRMIQSEDEGMQPDRVSFNTVLHSLSRSRAVGAPERAESLLNYMEQLYLDGNMENEAAKPDTTTFSSVINAFARGTCKGTADQDAQQQPNHQIPTYKINKAKELLSRMEQWYLSTDCQDEELKPNSIPYTSAINACAYAFSGPTPKKSEATILESKQAAFETAKSIFESCDQIGALDHITYSTMLIACQNLLPNSTTERSSAVEWIMEHCIWNGHVSVIVLTELKKVLRNDNFLFHKLLRGHAKHIQTRIAPSYKRNNRAKKGGGRCNGGNNNKGRLELLVDMNDFPQEWSREVRVNRRNRRNTRHSS